MILTTKDAHMQTLYVHTILKGFNAERGYKTTTFVHPHEYDGTPSGCVGLYSWTDDKSIILGVMEDGSLNEITPHYFPQDCLDVLARNFKRVISKKSEFNGTTTP
jgi:hypothetical protein